MHAALEQSIIVQQGCDPLPVVIVGAGPVGVRCAQQLHRLEPDLPIVIYGKEPWEPYNRVLLSSFLAGETKWAALTAGLELPDVDHIQSRLNCSVIDVDRERKTITDSTGLIQPYSRLVLAVGSRPRIPDIPGIGQANIYVFRDMNDAQKLFARRSRSRRTVIIGGGLLGLEAAHAMQRMNTEVCVIEHNARLMMGQLDEAGADLLKRHVEESGIRVLVDARLKCIHGEGVVSGVSLADGTRIDCDTVILATGILPNIELAMHAKLSFGRGIRVDDGMHTSDPDIYAIGECAEHRDMVYGIVAPGLEQAGVAAHSICRGAAHYTGSLEATQLKVLSLPVFSSGRVGERDGLDMARMAVYADEEAGIYRKAIVEHGRLIGFIAVGSSPETARVQEALLNERVIFPWQLWRFRSTGFLWPESESASVVDWPATAIVCNCNGVTRGQLGVAMAEGCATVEQMAACTRASTVCGACKPLLAELAGSEVVRTPVRARVPLLVGVALAMLITLAAMLIPAIPYEASVQHAWHWDVLWRDNFYKQVSGFTVLGLTAIGLLLTFRKRWRKVSFGDFAIWRLLHVTLGTLAVVALYVHTGGRMGSNLNFFLMFAFCGLILLGGLSAAVIAQEHRLVPGFSKRWRENGVWLHILLFWPVPVLLGFHVLKSYYF